MTRGVYVLVLWNERTQDIIIGSKGKMSFKRGYYVYVGSAMGNGSTSIENRLKRHFSKEKRKHWHIDYLLERVQIITAIWAESESPAECRLVQAIANHSDFEYGPRGFGNSDCRASCQTHLLYYTINASPYRTLFEVFDKLDLEFNIVQNLDES